MKPSPPVTRHRRPAKAPRLIDSRVHEPRPGFVGANDGVHGGCAPRRRPRATRQHRRSVGRGTQLASRRRCRSGRGTRSRPRRCARHRRARARELVLDRGSTRRVVHVVEHVEVAARAAAMVDATSSAGGRGKRRRPLTRRPSAGRRRRGRRTTPRARAGRPASVDVHPDRHRFDAHRRPSRQRSCAARPNDGPVPLQNVVELDDVAERWAARRRAGAVRRTTQAPVDAARRRRRRWRRPGGSARAPRAAAGPSASTSPRRTRPRPRRTPAHPAGTRRTRCPPSPWSHARCSALAPGGRHVPRPTRAILPALVVTGWFIAVWIVAAVAIVVVRRQRAAARPTTTSRSPARSRRQALDLLERDFPSQAGTTATVVFHDASGTLDDLPAQPAIAQSIAALGKLPQRRSVTDPFGPFAAGHLENGRSRSSTVQYDTQAPARSASTAFDDDAAGHRAGRGGRREARVRRRGRRLRRGAAQSATPTSSGCSLAVVILLFAFGSVVAMGLPILTALFGLGVGISLITHHRAVTDDRLARADARAR